MANYEILEGVPMPEDNRRKYRFGDMKVGDCFTFPERDRHSVRGAANQWTRVHGPGTEFTIRKVDANRHGCWRIK